MTQSDKYFDLIEHTASFGPFCNFHIITALTWLPFYGTSSKSYITKLETWPRFNLSPIIQMWACFEHIDYKLLFIGLQKRRDLQIIYLYLLWVCYTISSTFVWLISITLFFLLNSGILKFNVNNVGYLFLIFASMTTMISFRLAATSKPFFNIYIYQRNTICFKEGGLGVDLALCWGFF